MSNLMSHCKNWSQIVFTKLFASNTSFAARKRIRTTKNQYESLEHRRLLVFAAVPMTANLAEFQTELVETNVRISEQTMYIASQGETNNIEVNLRLGFVRVSQDDVPFYESLAFDLNAAEIERVVVIGNEGQDHLQIRQFDFANLMPGKMWAFSDLNQARRIEVIATSVEDISATAYWNDHFAAESTFDPKNLIRINGSEGADDIQMIGRNSSLFGRPAVQVTGQGFAIHADGFDDVIIRGNGGRDVAQLYGTSNDDTYTASGNFANLQTQTWRVGLRDVEWAKVDLGEGNDEARLGPFENRRNFRQQAGELIGGGSRLTGIENITINVRNTLEDSLVVDSSTVDNRVERESNGETDLIDFQVNGELFHWRFVGLEKFADLG